MSVVVPVSAGWDSRPRQELSCHGVMLETSVASISLDTVLDGGPIYVRADAANEVHWSSRRWELRRTIWLCVRCSSAWNEMTKATDCTVAAARSSEARGCGQSNHSAQEATRELLESG